MTAAMQSKIKLSYVAVYSSSKIQSGAHTVLKKKKRKKKKR